jgi:tRNA modification GTPase
MTYDLDQTICAIATAPGGAARGMVRVSGADALSIVGQLFWTEAGLAAQWPTRAAVVAGNLRLSLTEATRPAQAEFGPAASIASRDETIVPGELFVWPNHRSYTREPVVEIHTLGSAPILEALLAAVCRAGARLAEPGEFTLRAFLAGRIDLTQAEAVLGVIDAGRPEELDTALSQLAGGLARPLDTLRDELLQLLAELEAGLDFVEEDIEFVTRRELSNRLESACRLVAQIDSQMLSRQIIPAAYQIALIGPPNAGKSSLFNALIKRYGITDARQQSITPEALVSPLRGTTRDYLTARISLGGFACELIDTAGAESSNRHENGTSYPSRSAGAAAEIATAAVAVGIERGNLATVRALCLDACQFVACPSGSVSPIPTMPGCDLLVYTKMDLATPPVTPLLKPDVPSVWTSSCTGEGLEELGNLLCSLLATADTHQGGAIASTADRCRQTVRRASDALASALDLARQDGGSELIVAEIRSALNELGKVVGAIYTEDLLDRIFSTFCIGK